MVIGDRVFWEYPTGKICSGIINGIYSKGDHNVFYVFPDDHSDGNLIEDYKCLSVNDPKVKNYKIPKEESFVSLSLVLKKLLEFGVSSEIIQKLKEESWK